MKVKRQFGTIYDVWVLSLDDDEDATYAIPLATPPYDPTLTDPDTQTPTENPHITDTDTLPFITPSTDQPISLKKTVPELSKDKPNFCPSCGNKNTGTAYCPQCGTKLNSPT